MSPPFYTEEQFILYELYWAIMDRILNSPTKY